MRELVLSALVAAALALAPARAAFDQAEYEKAARTLLCDCGCHPQSVHDCACSRAGEMRREIADLVSGGKTGDGVIAFYVASRGEQIRIAPTAAGFNLLAWLGPLVGLLVATGSLLLLMRRWSRRTADAPALPPPPELDEAARTRIERELRGW